MMESQTPDASGSVSLEGVNPSEFRGLLQVTFSHRIPSNFTSTLFLETSAKRNIEFDSNIESRILKEITKLFSNQNKGHRFELRSLDDLAKTLGITKVREFESGNYSFESYGYSYAKHFESDQASPQEPETSVPLMINVHLNDQNYPREFAVVSSENFSDFDYEFRTVFHLLCILGYRRSELFTSDFHLRLLSIAYPLRQSA